MAGVAQLKAMVGMDTKAYKAGANQIKGTNKNIASSFKQIGAALGAAFSVSMITRATKELVNFASQIRHTADNLNLSTDSLQALNATALKYGLSIEQLNKSLAKLRQSQGQVIQGDTTYIDALKALNIEQSKFVEADTDKALEMIANAYVRSGQSAEAFAGVVDLLGRAGKNATAFLEELADKGLKGISEDAENAGMVIDEQLITKFELLGTRMEQAKTWGRRLFAELIGLTDKFGKGIGVTIRSIKEMRLPDEILAEMKEMELQEANINRLEEERIRLLKERADAEKAANEAGTISAEQKKKEYEAAQEQIKKLADASKKAEAAEKKKQNEEAAVRRAAAKEISDLTQEAKKLKDSMPDRRTSAVEGVSTLGADLSSQAQMGAFFGGDSVRMLQDDKAQKMREAAVKVAEETKMEIQTLNGKIDALRTALK